MLGTLGAMHFEVRTASTRGRTIGRSSSISHGESTGVTEIENYSRSAARTPEGKEE